MHCLALKLFHKNIEFPSAKTVITYYSLPVNKHSIYKMSKLSKHFYYKNTIEFPNIKLSNLDLLISKWFRKFEFSQDMGERDSMEFVHNRNKSKWVI